MGLSSPGIFDFCVEHACSSLESRSVYCIIVFVIRVIDDELNLEGQSSHQGLFVFIMTASVYRYKSL